MNTEVNKSVEVMSDETLTEEHEETKFCKYCGKKIPKEAVICTKCGLQVEEVKQDSNNITINNSSNSSNVNTNKIKVAGTNGEKNKWVAFFLCLFLGFFGAHKFYEGKTLLGVLYLLTIGLLGVGWFIDTVSLFFKPNPYYV